MSSEQVATSTPYHVASVELATINKHKFQRILHGLENKSKNANGEGEEDDGDNDVATRFQYNLFKSSWSVNMAEAVKSMDEGGYKVFRPNPKFPFLLNVHLHNNLPPVEVKHGYKNVIQICWPLNLYHQIISSGVLSSDDTTNIQQLDSTGLDFYSGHYMKSGAGMADLYNCMIGNVDYLDTWTDSLPSCEIQCPQPWFFSAHTTKGLPLLYGSSMEKISFRYSFNDKPENLLRMRARKEVSGSNGKSKLTKWKEIPFNKAYVYTISPKILDIKMEGRYAKITDGELKFHKETPRKIYYHDFISIDSDNPHSLGTSPNIDIQSDSPVNAIFWAAENVRARKVNNYSNYTTNPQNPYKGHNPVFETVIRHRKKIRDIIPHYNSSRMEVWNYFKSAPLQPGYNAKSIGYVTSSPFSVDSGLVLTPELNTNMTFKLKDTKPVEYRKRNEDEEVPPGSESSVKIRELDPKSHSTNEVEKFRIKIRLLVTRQVTFSDKGVKVVSATDEHLI